MRRSISEKAVGLFIRVISEGCGAQRFRQTAVRSAERVRLLTSASTVQCSETVSRISCFSEKTQQRRSKRDDYLRCDGWSAWHIPEGLQHCVVDLDPRPIMGRERSVDTGERKLHFTIGPVYCSLPRSGSLPTCFNFCGDVFTALERKCSLDHYNCGECPACPSNCEVCWDGG